MNRNAARLNLRSTFYDSPHGLQNPINRSTAFDVAKLGAQAMKDPRFRMVVSTQNYKVRKTENAELLRKQKMQEQNSNPSICSLASTATTTNIGEPEKKIPVRGNGRVYRWENTHRMI
jgi:D-alanyl-D-alanine carboxypeptidase